MRNLGLLGLTLAAIGCGDPAIELSLKLPPSAQIPANFDLSCVTAVEVKAVGNEQGDGNTVPADVLSDCVDLTRAPATFADIRTAIAGKFEFRIPQSGLAGIMVRGTMGTCADKVRSFEANFYGGAAYYEGDDSLTVPLVPNVSCNQHTTYTVRPIDLGALVTTKQCAMAKPSGADPVVFTGDIRPRMLGSAFAWTVFDYGATGVVPDAAGKAAIAAYASVSSPKSCIAVGFDSSTSYAGSCTNPGAPTICGLPGELELPVLDDLIPGTSLDPALMQQYGVPVFGVVWKQSPATTTVKAAIAGATVELEDPTQGKVVYTQFGAGKLTAIPNATSTGADGTFMVYLKGEATTLIVKQGASQQRLIVASSRDYPATVFAVLP